MHCPRCKNTTLRASRLENDLPAAGCEKCHGALVPLLYYRDWAERFGDGGEPPSPKSAIEDASDTDTSSAILCPKCARLMTKFKISGCISNRLDLCLSCDEAWLDDGEWELLKALQLSHKMPQVFTEHWQRDIRRQVAEETRRSVLRKIVGDDALTRTESFKEWLSEQPRRSDILAFLHAH